MHRLVASFLNYEAEPEDDDSDDEGDDNRPPTWLGGSGLQAPPDLANATTPEEAIAAAERLFFGEMIDVEQLRR